MPEAKQELIAVHVATNQTVLEVQQKQRRQMLIASAILLLALILVLLKDWHSWFAPAPASSAAAEPLERSIVLPEPSAPNNSPVAKATPSASPRNKVPAVPSTASTTSPAIVTSDRAVLPPLEVEVVAGSHHRSVKAASNSVRVDMQSETAEPQIVNNETSNSSNSAAPAVNAAETMRLSPNAAQVVSQSVEPNYPMLAKQMKVQGSVVLQALIGRNGNIEDLHVLSGPAILSSAAMQAVKQWRFRPYYLAGVPVETQARITVNFTISAN